MKLTKKDLRALADSRSWERGVAYAAAGAVGSLLESETQVVAKVWGQHEYFARLYRTNQGLEGECSCPMGADGVFCKHCVAVGLKLLDERSGGRVTQEAELRAWIEDQPRERLVEWIMERVIADEAFRNRLALSASTSASGDISPYYTAIDAATDIHDFVGYREAAAFADGIQEIVETIAELVQGEPPVEIVELIEYFLKAAEGALERVDDSDGNVMPLLDRLQELHLAACQKHPPDPEDLARRLIDWQLNGDWDTFSAAAETYHDVLGAQGRAVYRELADKEWAAVEPRKPGGDRFRYDRQRYCITRVMESLARASGDLDELVGVLSRDLSSPYEFLQIAEECKRRRRHDQALEWAERGHREFPGDQDGRLEEFLANEWRRRGDHGRAVEVAWRQFQAKPDLRSFQFLKPHAKRAGCWEAKRTKALELLGEQGRDASALVETLIWEKDLDAAWEAATAGGCYDSLWMNLAAKREKTHPEDAIHIYRERIDPIVSRGGNHAYEEAVGLLKRVGKLMRRIDQADYFDEYVKDLAHRHKRKRNFLKLLPKTN